MIIRTTNKAHFKTNKDKIITLKKKKGNEITFFNIKDNKIKLSEGILQSKMIPKHMKHFADQSIFYSIKTKKNLILFQRLTDVNFIISEEKDKFKKIYVLDLNIGDEIICLDEGKFEDNYYFDEVIDISIIDNNEDNDLIKTLSNYFINTKENQGLIINNILVV